MPSLTSDEATLHRTQQALHGACLLCGARNPLGFRLNFRVEADGSVSAKTLSPNHLQGYDGLLHGGVISALLDSAMANCLFARGIRALTAEMSVKFRKPVRCGVPVTVRAAIIKEYPPLYTLSASLEQNGVQAATAESKFMETDPA